MNVYYLLKVTNFVIRTRSFIVAWSFDYSRNLFCWSHKLCSSRDFCANEKVIALELQYNDQAVVNFTSQMFCSSLKV